MVFFRPEKARRWQSGRSVACKVLLVSGCLAIFGCGNASIARETSAATASFTPAGSAAMIPTAPSSSAPATTKTGPPAPVDTAFIRVPDAGILLPVPRGWRTLTAIQLADPTGLAELSRAYPGAAQLLSGMGGVSGRATPAFLAFDPVAAQVAGSAVANLAVLTSQPSVRGFLLDVVAGFICQALQTSLGAPSSPSREHRMLPVGDAIRCGYDLAPGASGPMSATAWIIGAPSGTLLVTLTGPTRALGPITADGIATSIRPLA